MERQRHVNQWLGTRTEDWLNLERQLPALEDSQVLRLEDLRRAVHAYPELARDVAVSRREAPGSRTTAYLEAMYRRLHRALFRQRRAGLADVKALLRSEIPAITYTLRWRIVAVGLGFLLSALAGWMLVWQFPELAALFASEDMIEGVQRGELWTEGLFNVVPSSVLSLQILTNNIFVALTTLCLGVLYGLGTIYIIALNGLMVGGVFALTARHGMAGELFDFVVAHGCVELSVVVVAGAIGFSVGESLAHPGRNSRLVAFQIALQSGIKLMAVCVVFLIGAGAIEGFISPDPGISRATRIAIGGAYWLVFIFALCGWRFRLPAPYTRF
jgi:uncharacterized membrane protein SpoIIM required for sporulation